MESRLIADTALLLLFLTGIVVLGLVRWRRPRYQRAKRHDVAVSHIEEEQVRRAATEQLLPKNLNWGQIRHAVVRILTVISLLLGLNYLAWRYVNSINWDVWPIALALIAAETYSYLDGFLFCLAVWRVKRRLPPGPPPPGATADVFITCYNEPVELVRQTARAAKNIRYPHETYILDDGNSPQMQAMAEQEGVGYLVRSIEWKDRPRHAKAGNLNNAIFRTTGEFFLILDADQIPSPDILDKTLGYFRDEKVAFVQTPQWFYNVPPGDPYGSQATLFYGPIQQGKDGWNAAFFCGSNAVLRREALMQVGIVNYARELEARVRRALRTATRLLRKAERGLATEGESARAALREVQTGVQEAKRALKKGAPVQEVTRIFQERAASASRLLVRDDLSRIRAELADVPGLDAPDLQGTLSFALEDEEVLDALTNRANTPLAAIETVRNLLLAVDVDRADEALPVQPLATISVTEDMATAMRLHALGWKSAYHNEILAKGLAPEDLRSALQQRLRWAQGTIQVMLRENPLFVRGLSLGQRLMYFGTMWGYLSGFFVLIYLVAPALYLLFGTLPIRAFSSDFFWHLLPFHIVNQLLFIVIGWGRATWRGQQYSVALFPVWIKAVVTAGANVFFNRKLGFVVTPKTRQGGVYFNLVRPQLAMIGLLVTAIVVGLLKLEVGLVTDQLAVLIGVAWACYDLVALSVVMDAATYQPQEHPAGAGAVHSGESAASAHGRILAG